MLLIQNKLTMSLKSRNMTLLGHARRRRYHVHIITLFVTLATYQIINRQISAVIRIFNACHVAIITL